MKKFEAKTICGLTLPTLALVGFASLLSLRSQKRDFGSPYRIIENRVVTEDAMSQKEKTVARICHVPVGQALCLRVNVQANSSSFWEKWLWNAPGHRVFVNGSSARDATSGKYLLCAYSGSASGDRETQTDIYDRRDFVGREVIISFPLSWSDDETIHTRTLAHRLKL